MAHIPDKIKTIDGSKETLRLAVRITDLWFVGVADKLEQAEMVMVDSNVCFHFVFFLFFICLPLYLKVESSLGHDVSKPIGPQCPILKAYTY